PHDATGAVGEPVEDALADQARRQLRLVDPLQQRARHREAELLGPSPLDEEQIEARVALAPDGAALERAREHPQERRRRAEVRRRGGRARARALERSSAGAAHRVLLRLPIAIASGGPTGRRASGRVRTATSERALAPLCTGGCSAWAPACGSRR